MVTLKEAFSVSWKRFIKKIDRTNRHYAKKVGLTDMEMSVVISKQAEIRELAEVIYKDATTKGE